MTEEIKSRGILTPNDRTLIQQDWESRPRNEKQTIYNTRSRIRTRVDELVVDLRLLQQYQPELANEILLILKTAEWRDSDVVYSGVQQAGEPAVKVGDNHLRDSTDTPDSVDKSIFSWGEKSESAEQLAFNLLCDATDRKIAQEHSTLFMIDQTAQFEDQWEITAERIQRWVDEIPSSVL